MHLLHDFFKRQSLKYLKMFISSKNESSIHYFLYNFFFHLILDYRAKEVDSKEFFNIYSSVSHHHEIR